MGCAGHRGFTLVELLLALALGAIVMLGLQRALFMGASVGEQVSNGVALDRDARFAFERITRALRDTDRLLLPLPDDPATDWFENVRAEWLPARPPTGSSSKDTAVLAVALPHNIDSNNDGVPDADNDLDGRLDEDWGADVTNDAASGLSGIDDDGDGLVDEEANSEDDDETGVANEDPVNGLDDDGDGRIDEDSNIDMNGDGAPGVAGVDDDNDGQVDEGVARDDDEDGLTDEDWLDTLVFSLDDDTLVERRSVPWDANGDGSINGADYVSTVIASGVSLFSVEREESRLGAGLLVHVQLELTDTSGVAVLLQTRLQVGDRLGSLL